MTPHPAPGLARSPCRGSFFRPVRRDSVETPAHVLRGSLGPCSQWGFGRGPEGTFTAGGCLTAARRAAHGVWRPPSCRRESSALQSPPLGPVERGHPCPRSFWSPGSLRSSWCGFTPSCVMVLNALLFRPC